MKPAGFAARVYAGFPQNDVALTPVRVLMLIPDPGAGRVKQITRPLLYCFLKFFALAFEIGVPPEPELAGEGDVRMNPPLSGVQAGASRTEPPGQSSITWRSPR
jgi:hypothetical protein